MLVESEVSKKLPSADDERTAIIKAVIEEIRPNLQRDGGDCQLIEIDGNKIMVKLTGACVFCKLSSATLEGIQARVGGTAGGTRAHHPGRWSCESAALKEAFRAADLSRQQCDDAHGSRRRRGDVAVFLRPVRQRFLGPRLRQ